MLRIVLILLLTMAYCPQALHAQQPDSSFVNFIPGEKVLFEDNFGNDAAKKFPTRWNMAQCTEAQYAYAKKSWVVEKEDDGPLLRSATTFVHISPRMSFPKDSFTIEFDCLFEDATSCAEIYLLQQAPATPCKEVSFHLLSWGKVNVFYESKEPRYSTSFAGDFDHTEWHHFALSYCHKEINCYTDGRLSMHIPDCGFTPAALSIGCVAPVKFRYVSIARITPGNSLDDILTKKKFVTHAIHFDPGRSVVRHESMGFIRQLARFLQLNPSVILRIDGHTDSDGSAAANMTLSRDRAEEVKMLLINAGIDGQRISTKGYGASKPVKPNSNPENKAENRRVEFIRL